MFLFNDAPNLTSRLHEVRAKVVYCQWQCTRLQTLTMTQPPGSHRPLHGLHLTANKVPHTRSCVGIGHSQRECSPLYRGEVHPPPPHTHTQGGYKEGSVLFNDALNTFYLRLYGVRHMVKDHSDEKGNPLPLLYGLLIPTDRIAHTTTFVTPVVEHWLERETAEWVNLKDRSDDPSHHEQTLLPRRYISLLPSRWRQQTRECLFKILVPASAPRLV